MPVSFLGDVMLLHRGSFMYSAWKFIYSAWNLMQCLVKAKGFIGHTEHVLASRSVSPKRACQQRYEGKCVTHQQ